MKKKLAVVLAVAMVLFLAACGQEDKQGVEPQAGNTIHIRPSVGLVVYTGEAEDDGFNALIWRGITSCADVVDGDYSNADPEIDGAARIEAMAESGHQLIWGSEAAAAEDILRAAKAHPEVSFALCDTYLAQLPDNVTAVSYRGWEGAFLAGYAAGMMTETDKVGMLGGCNEEVINQFEYGYMAGVSYAAAERGRDIEVYVIYAGTYTDEARGQELAQTMYADHCDVIYQAAGVTGLGAIREAQAQGKYIIGSDTDQSVCAPEAVMMSVTKDLASTVSGVTRSFAAGDFPGGQSVTYGLKEGAVGAVMTDLLPAALREKVGTLKQAIIDGTLQPPNDRAGYEAFVAGL